MQILGYVLVVVADLLYALSMLAKNKVILLILFFVSDVVFAFQYLCFNNGETGALTIVVDILFLVAVFILKKYKKEKYIPIFAGASILITIILAISSWSGTISLLPMFALICYFTGMALSKFYFIKLGAMCRNILNIIYMFILEQYVGAGLEICLAITALIGVVLAIIQKERTIEKDNQKRDF